MAADNTMPVQLGVGVSGSGGGVMFDWPSAAKIAEATRRVLAQGAKPLVTTRKGPYLAGGTVSAPADRAIRIVEAVESDLELGPHLICRTLQAIGPTAENPIVQYVDSSVQIVNVTIGGTITNQTFTISLGGVGATFTANNSTADQVRDGLIASWNSGPYATFATASNGGVGIVTMTATPDDLVYTLNTPGGGATFEQANVSDFIAYPDMAWVQYAYPQASPLGDTYVQGNHYWLKRLGSLNVVLSTPVGVTGQRTFLADVQYDDDGCITGFLRWTDTYVNGQLVRTE